MPRKSPKRNDGSETKPKGTPSLKKAVGNSKTSEKKKGSTPPKPAKTTISSDQAAVFASPKSLKSTDKRDMMEIIGSAPKVPGVFQEPKPRDREGDYLVSLTVDMTMKPEAINLSRAYNRGQHVVAIFVPLNDVSEWPMWKAFDTGEILQAHHGSDFERRFEVTTAFMADALSMSARNLQLLVKQGHAKKFGHGRYDLVGTFKGYLAKQLDEYQGRGGKEYSEERTKDKREQRLMRELDRRQKAEQLVDAEEYKAKAFEMGMKYRKAVENLIPRVSPQLVHAKSQAKVRAILKPEIDQILTSLALNQDPKPKRKKSAGSSRKRK